MTQKHLFERDMLPDPIAQFTCWYHEMKTLFPNFEAEAMCLSTINPEGYPEGRMVLLKSFDIHGFVFYTNLNSTKGKSLLATPKASLVFYWIPMERAIRILGDVLKVDSKEADVYYATRPRGSQLGAWASKQSEKLENRQVLEDRYTDFIKNFDGKPIPRPPYWSGFRVEPFKIEFWQASEYRLHDRFQYIRIDERHWEMLRLYP